MGEIKNDWRRPIHDLPLLRDDVLPSQKILKDIKIHNKESNDKKSIWEKIKEAAEVEKNPIIDLKERVYLKSELQMMGYTVNSPVKEHTTAGIDKVKDMKISEVLSSPKTQKLKNDSSVFQKENKYSLIYETSNCLPKERNVSFTQNSKKLNVSLNQIASAPLKDLISNMQRYDVNDDIKVLEPEIF